MAGIYTLRTRQKEAPADRLVLLFGHLGNLKCSAEVNSASAKVLCRRPKTLVRRKSAAPPCGAPVWWASIVYRQDKEKKHLLCGCFFVVWRNLRCPAGADPAWAALPCGALASAGI